MPATMGAGRSSERIELRPRRATTIAVNPTAAGVMPSSRYGIGPACWIPCLSTSVYAAIVDAIPRAKAVPTMSAWPRRPRTRMTPSPTRQTPAACAAAGGGEGPAPGRGSRTGGGKPPGGPSQEGGPGAASAGDDGGPMRTRPRAITFDFNGTLSDDEQIMCAIYEQLFAEHGRPMSQDDYYAALAGNTEEAIIGGWFGVPGEEPEEPGAERVKRHQGAVAGAMQVE